jgi:hypothetical protein
VICPVDNPILGQLFGANPQIYAQFGMKGHNGQDIICGSGTPIRAPEDGVITVSANGTTDQYTGAYIAGETIVLQGEYEHWLLHNSKRLVSVGQKVNQGQVIAFSGYTGFVEPPGEAGAHCHWGVRPLHPDVNNGYRGFVDPLTVKEKPMLFNEGDRKNINEYFYGEDLKRFQNAPGKEFKDAMYYGVFETDEFRIDQLVNPGDVAAINAAFGRTDGDTMVGKTWKTVFYEYTIKHIPKEGCSAEERQFLDLRKKI